MKTVIAMALFHWILKDSGALFCQDIGQSAVVMVFVGQKNIQGSRRNLQLFERLFQNLQAGFIPKSGVHHQASGISRNHINLDLAYSMGIAVQINLINPRKQFLHPLHISLPPSGSISASDLPSICGQLLQSEFPINFPPPRRLENAQINTAWNTQSEPLIRLLQCPISYGTKEY